MRKRPPSDRRGGWWLNGIYYRTEEKYLERVAFDERCRERKARLMAERELDEEEA